jgi:HSP20 family molecular chaperone IbpA
MQSKENATKAFDPDVVVAKAEVPGIDPKEVEITLQAASS